MTDPLPAAAPAPPWETGRRVLVLIAHPDDEVVGCGTAIMRARAAGAAVFGLVLTTGIPARDRLWPWERRRHAGYVARRRDENRAAAARLGLRAIEYLDTPTRMLRTCLTETRAQVREALTRLCIDTVWAPAYEGGHADHDSANAIAASLVRAPTPDDVRVYEYAEYNFAGGAIRSQAFPCALGTETTLWLEPAERAFKTELLAVYASARRDLDYVGVARECFRPIATYAYTRPPHPGKLFYERFQWVFFHHPRVDFTRPAEVCRAIESFGAAVGIPMT